MAMETAHLCNTDSHGTTVKTHINDIDSGTSNSTVDRLASKFIGTSNLSYRFINFSSTMPVHFFN
jgi:hypothetical protein